MEKLVKKKAPEDTRRPKEEPEKEIDTMSPDGELCASLARTAIC